MQLRDIDLSSPDFFVNGWPHEAFKVLRAEAPVYWHQDNRFGGGFWVVSKYRDVMTVQLDPKTYSSYRGGTILRKFEEGQELEGNRAIMLNMDAPRHTRFRRLVNLGFSPKMVSRMEPHVREIASKIVDTVAARGECDFVTDVAAELPLQVIVEMMGVPSEDRHKVFDWSNRLIGFDDPEYSHNSEEAGKMASMEMFMYASQLAAERREHPRDDLISVLLEAEVDGEQLTDLEFNSFFLLLAVAGNETTRNLVSGGMLALMENPEQRGRLLANPSLLPTAVEEMLRWVSPVMYFRRTTTCDTELGGQQIREGDRVTVWYGSANRDEEMFPNADRFDVSRHPNEHIAFGIGHHFCLGANLARLEIQVMFEELLRRLPDMQLAGPVERLRSNFINGIKRIPVHFTPERRAH